MRLNTVPRIHVRWHTTVYNSGFKGIQSHWPQIFSLICSCPPWETEREIKIFEKVYWVLKIVCAPNLALISYICVCVACGEYMCVHMLMEDGGWYWEFSLISLPLIHWGRVSHFKAVLYDRASSLRSSPLSEPPIHWAQEMSPTSSGRLQGLWGSELLSPHLCSKLFIHWAIFPAWLS